MDPSTPLRSLPGIGPVRSRRLAEAGYETVGDLLAHLPARYEDRTTVLPVAGALERLRTEEEPLAVTVRGRLEAVRRIRLRRRGLSMVRARLADASGSLDVLWFNRPYLASSIDPETEYLLHGRLRPRRGRSRSRAAAGPAPSGPPELVNPSCEEAERALQGGRIVPVYPALGPLGPATVRRLLARALEGADFDAFPEPLPADLLERRGLPPLGPSLRRLHLPDAGDEGSRDADAERLNRRRSPAHRRLIYGELLEQQLALAELRRRRAARSKRHRYDDPRGTARARAAAREILPFRLTGDQRRALEEIAADLRRPEPMARLLQGDVGSGKTIVAVLALVLALENGLQGAFMAPTELLAEQHHRRLTRLLGERYRIGLVTGSVPGSGRGSGSGGEAVREALAEGRIDLAVGTHALIQEEVAFRRLGLAVIDEQHRFGVVQRRALRAKGDRPDVLVMTATPIPRSLALTAFGDLDLSVIAELPPGRRAPVTEVRGPEDREATHGELVRRLEAGERGFVVFPRIRADDEDGAGIPCLEVEGEALRVRLEERLSGGSGISEAGAVAVVHGGTPVDERERIMRDFAEGRVRALLATTVIEVGVDVPEATVMVIEGAERFGLSQLHQLRGRVGRGSAPARCVALLASAEPTDEARARMAAFAATTDGFEIAERDLEIRGFGDLLGTRQAGLAGFRVADPARHRDLLETAREDARALVGRLGEPGLEILRRRVERAVRRAEAAGAPGETT